MISEQLLEKLTEYTNAPSENTLFEIKEETGEDLDAMIIPCADFDRICYYAIKVDDGILVIPCTSVDSLKSDEGEETQIDSINFNLNISYLLKPEEYKDFAKDQMENLDYCKKLILEFTEQSHEEISIDPDKQKLQWLKNYLWNTSLSWEDSIDPGDITVENTQEWNQARRLTGLINGKFSFKNIQLFLELYEETSSLYKDCLNIVNKMDQMDEDEFEEKYQEVIKDKE